MDLIDKLVQRIDVGHPDECWPWTGYVKPSGYGQFKHRGTTSAAHRWVYSEFVGPIPTGLDIDHLCRNRMCMNPDHLEPVTRRENTLRGEGIAAQQAKRTHCLNGHEFNEENTAVYDNRRHCLPCQKARRP